MVRHLVVALTVAFVATLLTLPLMTPAQTPGARLDPAAGVPKAYEVQGTIAKVDPSHGTMKVSTGFFGLMGPTLKVTSDTQIQVEGRQATLADVKPGAKVWASYESRDGRNFAMRIDQTPAETTAKPPTY